MNSKTLVILILAFLLVIFILQNTMVIPIKILFWSLRMSRSLLIFLFFFLGLLLGYLLFTGKKKKGN